ncbi:uncharacterized protein LOC129597565 isoform X2 [Paramacrobiotus metropolitanus]|nr:uncharacterized protein LOC129597565 isoform X2 [Paramacrobiotus metropolitanus]
MNDAEAQKKPSLDGQPNTGQGRIWAVLVLASLLNLLFVVLLVYFETKPLKEPVEPVKQCSGNVTAPVSKILGSVRAGAANASQTNVLPTALSWGKYQVTHSYVMTVPYYHHNVLIYQQTKGPLNTSTDGREKYYYQPALMMNTEKTRVSMNPFTNRYELLLPVVLWNEAYEDHIRQQIMDQTGKNDFLLSVIPMEEVRVKSVRPKPQIQLVTRWMAFASQPSVVTFRIVCKDNESCVELLQQIRSSPQQFVGDLRVFYSLESQGSTGKRMTVTAEHVQHSSMYAAINQKLPNKDPIYLTSDDANTLQREIMNNVQATEVEDEDFVSDASQPTLMGLINEALGLATRSSKDFEEHMWDSVFWNDDNARPDKVTKRLNDVARKLDAQSRSKLRTEQEKTQKFGVQADISGSYKKVTVEAGANFGQEAVELTNKEKEELKRAVEESKGKSVVEGELFVPKAMELKRINNGNIRSGAALTTTIVRVSKAKSQISDIIKIIDLHGENATADQIFVAADRQPEVFHVRAKESFILFTREEAIEICRQYSAKLASVAQVERAWVEGADWCSAGHADDNRVAYPAHVCYTYAKSFDGSTLLPLQERSASCNDEEAHKKSFVYQTNTKDEDGGYKESWRFGVNCWGLKPNSKVNVQHGGRMLQV